MKGGSDAAFFRALQTARSAAHCAQQHRAVGQPKRGGRGRAERSETRTQARAQARARAERARRDGRAKVTKRTSPTRTARGWRDERSETRQNAANGGGAERAGRRAVGCPCGAPTFCLRRPYLGTPPTAHLVPYKPSIYRGWRCVGYRPLLANERRCYLHRQGLRPATALFGKLIHLSADSASERCIFAVGKLHIRLRKGAYSGRCIAGAGVGKPAALHRRRW